MKTVELFALLFLVYAVVRYSAVRIVMGKSIAVRELLIKSFFYALAGIIVSNIKNTKKEKVKQD
jgi:hypothetical protein